MARSQQRAASFKRRTRGTEVSVEFQLDGAGCSEVETPFEALNILLEMLTGHGSMDLRLTQRSNDHADEGYSIDDLASALAEGINRAMGPRPQIRQFGSEILPVGDALVLCAVDVVSPPVYASNVAFSSDEIDGVSTELIKRFLSTFADRLGASIHLRVLDGMDDTNKVRAMFLALGRALAVACEPADREGAREVAVDIDYEDGFTATADDLAEAMLVRQDERTQGGRGRPRRPRPSDENWETDEAATDADADADADVAERDGGDDEQQNGRRRRRGRRGGRGCRRSEPTDSPTEDAVAEERPERPEWNEASDADAEREEVEASGDADEGDDDSRRGRTRRGRRGRGRGRGAGESEATETDSNEGGVGLLEEEREPSPEPVGAEPAEASPGRGRGRGRSRGRRGSASDDAPAETAVAEPTGGGDDGILDFVTQPAEAPSGGGGGGGRRGTSRGAPRGGRRRR